MWHAEQTVRASMGVEPQHRRLGSFWDIDRSFVFAITCEIELLSLLQDIATQAHPTRSFYCPLSNRDRQVRFEPSSFSQFWRDMVYEDFP